MPIHVARPYIFKNEHRHSVSQTTDRPWGRKAGSNMGSVGTVPKCDSLLTSETGDLFNFSSNYLLSQFVQSAWRRRNAGMSR